VATFCLSGRAEDRCPVAVRPGLVWPAVVIALGVIGLGAGIVWRHAREAAVVLGTAAARGTHETGRARPLARPFALGGPAPAAATEDVPGWVQLEGVPPRTIAGRVVSTG